MTETESSSPLENFWKTNLPTRNLLIIIVLTYVILTILSIIEGEGLEISGKFLVIVGQYNQKVLDGHVYQLLTAIFVHVNILHFLSNSLFLLIYGFRAEERFLNWQYILIFIVSALIGNLLSLALFSPETISCGASGGIFGLLGADLKLAYEEEKRKSMWIYVGTGVIFFSFSAGVNVNFIAHGVGLIVGFILPFILKNRKPREILIDVET